ncbi:hypothetical protein [Actinomyces ruminicola]|uniref:hypothetical protein n=1 Tax=Actinomyces ruminicola TaxID=332524 RepID=UPI0021C27789|nr:hypothetical protein [Actinomyces ruminicola]
MNQANPQRSVQRYQRIELVGTPHNRQHNGFGIGDRRLQRATRRQPLNPVDDDPPHSGRDMTAPAPNRDVNRSRLLAEGNPVVGKSVPASQQPADAPGNNLRPVGLREGDDPLGIGTDLASLH